jgi:hypothetical protein
MVGLWFNQASDTLTIHPSHWPDDHIGRVSVVVELDLKIQRRIKIHHFLRLPSATTAPTSPSESIRA